MDLKDILVFLDEGSASEGRLELAANIAHDHRACLSAVFMQNNRVSQATPSPCCAVAWDVSRAAAFWRDRYCTGAVVADIAEQKFRDRRRCINVEGDWYPIDGTDLAELITLARAADLVIIGQVNPNARPTPAWRPEEIVISCGRPVLMVPYIGSYVTGRPPRSGRVGRVARGCAGTERCPAVDQCRRRSHGDDGARPRRKILTTTALRLNASSAIWRGTALPPARTSNYRWVPPYPMCCYRDQSTSLPI